MDYSKRSLTDPALLRETGSLRREESERLPHLLACLAEVERRGLHLDLGYGDLFDYCRRGLGYSEGAAARRVHSARAAAAFPELYTHLRDSTLSLSALSRLKPHLTAANVSRVAALAAGKTFREVDELACELAAAKAAEELPPAAPEDPPAELPLRAAIPGEPRPVGAASSEPPKTRDTIRAERPGTLRFSFQADASLRSRLEAVKAMMSHRLASTRLEDVIGALADEYLARRAPRDRIAASGPSRRRTRRIPAAVKDAVRRRDGDRCAFVSPDGVRCGSTFRLEFDHVRPWARGGRSDDPSNIRRLCRAHNLRRARQMFGGSVPERGG
ncbi:MAG: HNH endonuclease [Elusimicrobia bacterium]|nr:HNH endonuclease [Elusimicrobiota bacterium]